jgi:hypothetical protein
MMPLGAEGAGFLIIVFSNVLLNLLKRVCILPPSFLTRARPDAPGSQVPVEARGQKRDANGKKNFPVEGPSFKADQPGGLAYISPRQEMIARDTQLTGQTSDDLTNVNDQFVFLLIASVLAPNQRVVVFRTEVMTASGAVRIFAAICADWLVQASAHASKKGLF